MSAIGRVFIVLNLILAAGFVVMSGTFLQRHTDWKQRFEAKQTELADAKAAAEARDREVAAKFNEQDRELRSNKTRADDLENTNKQINEESQRLKNQLADLAGDIKNLTSQAQTMASQIEQSGQKSDQSYKMAMEAAALRDQAVSDKAVAENALSDAKRRIDELENGVAEATAKIAALTKDIGEKDVLISYATSKLPGLIAMAQPDLQGTVENVAPTGNLLTVRVTNNPANAELKAGYTLAIYRNRDYKGDAVITEVEGEFAFCRVTKKVEGASISAGDSAATNVGGI